jgi:hypothetical protein
MDGEELYVETWLDADVADLWAATQEPDEHQRWDLRFTDIDYLPRPDESDPQRFEYATHVGFGVGVTGEGESTGETREGGVRTSALRFRSDDPKSLIAEGTGYWKYVPEDDGARFLTGYNYRVRFGRVGRLFDRLVLRPLMVWATAWSFDRLRLWLEADVSPAASIRAAAAHAGARLGLVLVWLYAGLVPKLLGPHPEELTLAGAALPPGLGPEPAVLALGAAEVGLAGVLLVGWHRRWPLLLSAAATVAVVGAGVLARPDLLAHPLSPLPLGAAMLGLAAAGSATVEDLPRASRCITDRADSRLPWNSGAGAAETDHVGGEAA